MVSLRDFVFDNSLIMKFVKRWHPETHTFHLSWSEATITLQDVAYHLELHAHREPVGCDRVCHMPGMDDLETLRQHVRCYILLLIGGYLRTDKPNNLVQLRWLPLFEDFEKCRGLSWSSAVLAWTYHSLCSGVEKRRFLMHRTHIQCMIVTWHI
ncbi:hypothetical protein Ahy_A05g024672 [Arachis hypogaea]|uniref:Aminotransferase-like plant mobile domain-containing protein n=1 Tax=Arachis hypogaea TaxID=3818 RepID=A0A445D734_ARAHY|nr:hypothetical protein Ahy_A05g024672 [Arachis hypogaea]